MFNRTFIGLLDTDTVYINLNKEYMKKLSIFLKAGWQQGKDPYGSPCLSHKYYKGITNLTTKLIKNPYYDPMLTEKVTNDNVITEAQMHFDIHHEPLKEKKIYCSWCKTMRKVHKIHYTDRDERVVKYMCVICNKILKTEPYRKEE